MEGMRVINSFGEALTVNDLTAEYFEGLSNDEIEYMDDLVTLFDSKFKLYKAERLKRLKKDVRFNKFELKEKKADYIPDTLPIKQAFYKKYKLDAFDLKSPAKLREEFGKRVNEDIDKVIVKDTTKAFSRKK